MKIDFPPLRALNYFQNEILRFKRSNENRGEIAQGNTVSLKRLKKNYYYHHPTSSLLVQENGEH